MYSQGSIYTRAGRKKISAHVASSIHNTPIEGIWHWFLQTFGINIKDLHGFEIGIYNHNNVIYPYAVPHSPSFPRGSFMIHLLEDNYFTGYGQRYYKINFVE
jgi:hypothetical protein